MKNVVDNAGGGRQAGARAKERNEVSPKEGRNTQLVLLGEQAREKTHGTSVPCSAAQPHGLSLWSAPAGQKEGRKGEWAEKSWVNQKAVTAPAGCGFPSRLVQRDWNTQGNVDQRSTHTQVFLNVP